MIAIWEISCQIWVHLIGRQMVLRKFEPVRSVGRRTARRCIVVSRIVSSSARRGSGTCIDVKGVGPRIWIRDQSQMSFTARIRATSLTLPEGGMTLPAYRAFDESDDHWQMDIGIGAMAPSSNRRRGWACRLRFCLRVTESRLMRTCG